MEISARNAIYRSDGYVSQASRGALQSSSSRNGAVSNLYLALLEAHCKCVLQELALITIIAIPNYHRPTQFSSVKHQSDKVEFTQQKYTLLQQPHNLGNHNLCNHNHKQNNDQQNQHHNHQP